MVVRTVALACALAIASGAGGAAWAQPAQETSAQSTQAGTPQQHQAIARLIEVWGFVKYHHSDARTGRMAMDQAFFELYPKIANAGSSAGADAILVQWLDQIGTGAPCDPCAGDPAAQEREVALASPTTGWIATLPEPIAQRIKAIFENRSGDPANFQIETARVVGNSQFLNEPDYKSTGRDEPALRMLGAARVWNALRYWFPYRDVMDADVATILAPAVGDVLAASSRDDYKQALARLVAKSDDGHGFIMAYRSAVYPPGECYLPYTWRFVEGELVVDGLQAHEDGVLQRGDRVRAIAGVDLAALREQYAPLISASNAASRDRILASRLAQGECAERAMTVERGAQTIELVTQWLPQDEAGLDFTRQSTRNGATIQQLESGHTYINMTQFERSDFPKLFETVNDSAGLIVDMRGYSRDFSAGMLAAWLIDAPIEFSRITQPDPATPGRFVWTDPMPANPASDGQRVTVPVVALVDAGAASSPEYQAMVLRAAGVPIIGQPTAGADGNVSTMPLPQDGAGMRFSGIGIFYPDKSPTQRIGIVPDIIVEPSLAGIGAGRDEQLERAIAHLRSLEDEQP